MGRNHGKVSKDQSPPSPISLARPGPWLHPWSSHNVTRSSHLPTESPLAPSQPALADVFLPMFSSASLSWTSSLESQPDQTESQKNIFAVVVALALH